MANKDKQKAMVIVGIVIFCSIVLIVSLIMGRIHPTSAELKYLPEGKGTSQIFVIP